MDNKIIEEKNKKYLRTNKIRRVCYRIPTLIIFLIAIICKEMAGFIVGIVWTLFSELAFLAITREEKAIDKLVKKKKYVFKDDIVKNIYSEYTNPHPTEADDYDYGMLCDYVAFENIDVQYSGNDAYAYEIGEQVVLQVVNYRGKNVIINIIKKRYFE